jgi:hypothetical protein
MFMRIAVACFALYCVHGAQNTARDSAALAQQGVTMAREASAQAPKAALSFCLENQTLCAKAMGAGSAEAPVPVTPPTRAAAAQDETYPLPPRRPASHKKA